MFLTSVMTPSGVVCHFQPQVAIGMRVDFTARFEIPAAMYGTNVDILAEMKSALEYAYNKHTADQKWRDQNR